MPKYLFISLLKVSAEVALKNGHLVASAQGSLNLLARKLIEYRFRFFKVESQQIKRIARMGYIIKPWLIVYLGISNKSRSPNLRCEGTSS